MAAEKLTKIDKLIFFNVENLDDSKEFVPH
jgi:hypothetical protein